VVCCKTYLHLRRLQPFHAQPVLPRHVLVPAPSAVFAVEVRVHAPLEPPRAVTFARALRLGSVVIPGAERRVIVIFEGVT